MLPDTWDVRKAAKLVSDQSLTEALAALYRSNPVSSYEDLDDTLITDQVRVMLFGDQYDDYVVEELNASIMELTRPSGAVQEELANHGSPMSLCSTVASRKFHDEDGVEVVVKKTSRFATTEANMAAAFLLQPQFIRAERVIERTAAMTHEHTNRIPALAKYTPGMIMRAHGVLRAQLPMPTPTPPKKDKK